MFKFNNYISSILLILFTYGEQLHAGTGYCLMSNGRLTASGVKDIPTGTEGIGESYGTLRLYFDYACNKLQSNDSFILVEDMSSYDANNNQSPTNIDGLVFEFPSSLLNSRGEIEWYIANNGNIDQSGTVFMEGKIVKTGVITNMSSMRPNVTFKYTFLKGINVTFSSNPTSGFWTEDQRGNYSHSVNLIETACQITFNTGATRVDFGELTRGETKTVPLTAKLEGCTGNNYTGASWKLIPQAIAGNSWTSDVLTSSGVNIPTVSYSFRPSGVGTNLQFNTSYLASGPGSGSVTGVFNVDVVAEVSPTSITGPFTNMVVLESEHY